MSIRRSLALLAVPAATLALTVTPALASTASTASTASPAQHAASSGTEIAVADVMRALDGPLAEVRGLRPEATTYEGAAVHLQDVWVAVRASLRSVLEEVTLDDVVRGRLPRAVARLTAEPDAWAPH